MKIDQHLTPIEGVRTIMEGESRRFRCTFEGLTSIDSISASEIYKDGKGSDLAGTLLSGSASETSNQVITEYVTAATTDGGKTYTLVLNLVVDGKAKPRKIQLNVIKKKARIAPYTG